MNALYFGPYKYNSPIGICSRDIVSSLLKEDIKVSTRHIFLNNPYENTTMVNFIAKDSEPLLNNYDCIIQHCPIEMMHVDRDFGKKYIAIPIIDYDINTYEYSVLKDFDTVCVDNVHHQKNLSKINIPSILLAYDIDSKKQNTNRINLGINNFTTKLYFIGNYQNNTSLINKLIVSFLLAFRDSQSVSLILFFNDKDRDKTTSAVEQNIQEIYKKLNFNSKLSPIQTIVQPVTEENMHIIHKDLDIFIDLSEEYDSGLNYHMAKTYGNFIINLDNTESVFVPCIDINQYGARHKYSVLTTSLVESMKTAIDKLNNKKIPTYKDTKTIVEIVNEYK